MKTLRTVSSILALLLAVMLTALGQQSESQEEQGSGKGIKPPTSSAKKPAPARRQAAPLAAKSSAVEAAIIENEKKIWGALKRKDYNSFSSFLADDQIYVSASGTYTKAQTIQILSDFTLTDYTLSDFKVVMVGADSAIITYRAKGKSVRKGEEKPPPAFDERTTSLWVKRAGVWQLVFHQETPVEQGQ